jgi:hypothetical protein
MDLVKESRALLNKQKIKEEIEDPSRSIIEGSFEKDEKGYNRLISIKIEGRKYYLNHKKDIESVELKKAINKALGLPDFFVAIDILHKIAMSLPLGLNECNFNHIVALIQDQKPKDSIEAILLGQFFLFNEIGLYTWSNASSSEWLPHSQYYSNTAAKFLTLSHKTINALTKYKAKGMQQVNVVHMHDNAKAILAGEIGG